MTAKLRQRNGDVDPETCNVVPNHEDSDGDERVDWSLLTKSGEDDLAGQPSLLRGGTLREYASIFPPIIDMSSTDHSLFPLFFTRLSVGV